MIQNKFGEIVYNENDIVDGLMKGVDIDQYQHAVIDFDVAQLNNQFFQKQFVNTLTAPTDNSQTVEQYDADNQNCFLMPDEYKQFNVAEYVLELCESQEQLQRAGKELLMFQERNMFPLLQYMKYLVDTMQENNIVWGVGRGSSVASYVLYLLGVHRIDSIYYNLDIEEFLR